MKKQRQDAEVPSTRGLSRRVVMKRTAALAAGTAASALASSKLIASPEAQTVAQPYEARPTLIIASPHKNVVETACGKVYGYVKDGIVSFRGIPYGASTAGKNRFMPPAQPEPWAGERSALYWGPVAPQPFTSTTDAPRGGWKHDREAFMFDWEDGHDSEDCLRINVWTPSINDNARRPVMMWLHGGGFVFGSCQELRMYPGDGLAHRGDVVAVSVNHRLGALGFANLMDYGEQYASSPNVGMLDLVLALQWVKTNIANFGGDPGRVLIFGQSGGGGKVSTLMGMPSAQGLFHRGVVESGSMLGDRSREDSARATTAVLAELGLNRHNISRIHEIPYQKIIEAAVHSERVSGAYGIHEGLGWGPVVDGTVLPRAAWTPDAPACSKNVPLIVGNTLNEFFNSVQMDEASLDSISMDEARKRLSGAGALSFSANLGKGTDHVIEVFRETYPRATPFTMFSIISAMATMRIDALTQAKRKAEQGGAPAYNYWFQWQTPILDGQARAFHCSELPFVFYQTEVCAPMTGGGPDALNLAGRMADAWISFARTGNPNHAGLPLWPAYDPVKMPTMIFDNQCVVKGDPNGEIRKAIVEARA
ncbi:MAG TPA: carboxylesterase family protein [Terriglobia bacterium]|nr:carboxylesterase family protein [Terriglobia bacterium]